MVWEMTEMGLILVAQERMDFSLPFHLLLNMLIYLVQLSIKI